MLNLKKMEKKLDAALKKDAKEYKNLSIIFFHGAKKLQVIKNLITARVTFAATNDFIINILLEYYLNNELLLQKNQMKAVNKQFFIKKEIHNLLSEKYNKKKTLFVNSIFEEPTIYNTIFKQK